MERFYYEWIEQCSIGLTINDLLIKFVVSTLYYQPISKGTAEL